jgi:transcriptional regulator with XRE-family HTH domain
VWDRPDIVKAYEKAARLVGRRIAAERQAKGYTQPALAERAALNPTLVSQIENGKTNFQWITLVAIAYALEVPLTRFMPDKPVR